MENVPQTLPFPLLPNPPPFSFFNLFRAELLHKLLGLQAFLVKKQIRTTEECSAGLGRVTWRHCRLTVDAFSYASLV